MFLGMLNEKEQKNFLETTLGKTINTGIDIGIRAVLPDYIEEQIIDLSYTGNILIDSNLRVLNDRDNQKYSKVYPEVVSSLKALISRGYSLFILSNKPDSLLQILIKELLSEINFKYIN